MCPDPTRAFCLSLSPDAQQCPWQPRWTSVPWLRGSAWWAGGSAIPQCDSSTHSEPLSLIPAPSEPGFPSVTRAFVARPQSWCWEPRAVHRAHSPVSGLGMGRCCTNHASPISPRCLCALQQRQAGQAPGSAAVTLGCMKLRRGRCGGKWAPLPGLARLLALSKLIASGCRGPGPAPAVPTPLAPPSGLLPHQGWHTAPHASSRPPV